ncbi:MAG: hypothetical protein IT260_03930 [Saprospiraceae bacterium]|nr:hypothetical protein [Saprospiraceae bacterium]
MHQPQQLFRDNLLQRFRDPDLLDFVQSTLNILSDGIDVDSTNGLKLEAKGGNRKLISFFEKIKDRSPVWNMAFDDGKRSQGLNFSEGEESRLFLQKGGNVGVGTTTPLFRMQVEGVVSMKGRVGDFAAGHVPADAQWKAILTNLDGCQGFEVFAHIIDADNSRHALTYAVLLMSDKKGNRNYIRTVDATSHWLWGRFLNKIRFRWTIDMENSRDSLRYKLEIRSRSRYGMPGGRIPQIFYRVSKLWDRNYENMGTPYSAAAGTPDDSRRVTMESPLEGPAHRTQPPPPTPPKKITITPGGG